MCALSHARRQHVVDICRGDGRVADADRDLIDRADDVADREQAIDAGHLVAIDDQLIVVVVLGAEAGRKTRLRIAAENDVDRVEIRARSVAANRRCRENHGRSFVLATFGIAYREAVSRNVEASHAGVDRLHAMFANLASKLVEQIRAGYSARNAGAVVTARDPAGAAVRDIENEDRAVETQQIKRSRPLGGVLRR